MKLRELYFPFLLIFLSAGAVFAQNCPTSVNIKNFGCIDQNIFRGAQPNEAGIKELAGLGVKTIISLRKPGKATRLEAIQAHNAGIDFINIPLGNWLGPQDSKIAEIQKKLNDSGNRRIFIHCQRGADRTGTAVAVYRISHDGWTSERVMTEAKSFHIGWWQVWMKDYIKDYYRDFQKQKSNFQKTVINF